MSTVKIKQLKFLLDSGETGVGAWGGVGGGVWLYIGPWASEISGQNPTLLVQRFG